MDKKNIWVAVAAALPGLLLAGQQWLEADAKAKEKQDVLDNYGEYVTDRLQRDEALERALFTCMRMLHGEPAADEGPGGGIMFLGPPAEMPPGDPGSLDELAEDFGYEQKSVEVE